MTDLEECPHGMGSPDWCGLCIGSKVPSVYISSGGMKYHKTPDCPALIEGQSMVDNPSPIQTVKCGSANLVGRNPCRTCKPIRCP